MGKSRKEMKSLALFIQGVHSIKIRAKLTRIFSYKIVDSVEVLVESSINYFSESNVTANLSELTRIRVNNLVS